MSEAEKNPIRAEAEQEAVQPEMAPEAAAPETGRETAEPENEKGTAAPETGRETAEPENEKEAAAPETAEKNKSRKGRNVKGKRTVGQEILSWVWTILGAVLVALLIRAVIFEPVRVDGHSMDDTLADGEIMFVSKFDYSSNWLSFFWQDDDAKEDAPRLVLGGNPSRNDVVVCRYPERGDVNFVKRVVGLPGETLSLQNGVLYVNGEKQEEAFLNDDYRSGSLNQMSDYTVPKKGDKLTFGLQNGYYQLLLNGEPWDARSTRLFCKDPDGKDMIFAARGTEITYQGKKTLNTDSGYAELIRTMADKEFTVDRDSFFLMGDHRNNSNDSRNVGAVDRSMIVGHVRQIVFPFGKWRGVQ
ncbi:MAG: signal peptidase I [Clostridia bacterium]|nr:signal peptidase I [Clostridia bacterium]